MAILRVTADHKNELKELLSPGAAGWIERENVFSLAEYGVYRHYEGVIQFTVREEEKPVGELLYLFVDPRSQRSGVAAQLLMAMEDVLIKSGISEVKTTISEDDSGLGEYLEDYGFTMEQSDTEWLTFPTFPADNDSVKKAVKKVTPLKDLTKREHGEIEELLKTVNSKVHLNDLNKQFSCIYRDPKQGEGIILAAKGEGHPTILGIHATGKNEEIICALLACCVISGLQKYAPRGMRLAVVDPKTAALFHKQFENYLYSEKTLTGTLLVEEPELDVVTETEEDEFYG